MRLLEARAADPMSMREAIRQLEFQAGATFAAEAALEIRAGLELARDQADVLGTIVMDPRSGPGRTWGDRLAALHLARLAAKAPPEALASNFLHHGILPELPDLLAGHPVSVISCRDLKPVIERSWRVDDVAVYQVPSAHATREVDGGYETAMHDVPIWPDAHHRICSELSVRERGEVFLVGAGVFGKDLCIRIRGLGGIALDMGAALDHIAGKLTREPVQWMHDLHTDGLPAAEIAARVQDRYGTRADPDRITEFLDAVSRYVGAADT